MGPITSSFYKIRQALCFAKTLSLANVLCTFLLRLLPSAIPDLMCSALLTASELVRKFARRISPAKALRLHGRRSLLRLSTLDPPSLSGYRLQHFLHFVKRFYLYFSNFSLSIENRPSPSGRRPVFPSEDQTQNQSVEDAGRNAKDQHRPRNDEELGGRSGNQALCLELQRR